MLLMDKVSTAARRSLVPWDEPLDDGDPYYLFAGRPSPSYTDEMGRRLLNKEVKRLLSDLSEAVRFRVDRAALAYLMPLTADPKRLAVAERHIFLPAKKTWIEMDDDTRRHGYLLCSEDCLFQNMTLDLFALGKANPLADRFYPPDRTILWAPWISREACGDDPIMRAPKRIVDPKKSNIETDLLMACLALLSTPRLYSTKLIERGKINRQRASRGKWPLLSFREVAISVLDPHGGDSEVRVMGMGSPKALHFVRAHLRIRSNGRLEWVRPHWRGDAQLGIKRPAYRLTA